MAFKNIIWIDVRKINIEIIEEKVLGIHKKSNKQKIHFILLVLCWTKQVKSAKFADKIKNYSSASCQRKHQVDHVNHNTTINHRPATIDHWQRTQEAHVFRCCFSISCFLRSTMETQSNELNFKRNTMFTESKVIGLEKFLRVQTTLSKSNGNLKYFANNYKLWKNIIIKSKSFQLHVAIFTGALRCRYL